MKTMRRVGGLTAGLWVCLAAAQPQGHDINPGALGANAIPPAETSAPWVDETWSLVLGNAVQLSFPNGAADFSATIPFRLEVDLLGRLGVWAEGSPIEAFAYSQRSLDAWAPNSPGGATKADVTVGTRFLITPGGGWVPAVGLRVMVKTATGEDLKNRRFLDAPGYQFDLLLGQRWAVDASSGWELAVNLGFLSWQQTNGQNDAFAASARVVWHLDAWAAKAELRGYFGWQKQDKPVALVLGLERQLGRGVFLFGALAQTFLDPLTSEVRAGLRFTGEAFEGLDPSPLVSPQAIVPD